MVNLLILLLVACGITAIATFILYGRARMREQEQEEKRYLRIHYTALFLVVLLGIIFLFYMVETAN